MNRILCLCLLAGFLCLSATAAPPDRTRSLTNKARALYQEGLALERYGQTDAARACFRAAIAQYREVLRRDPSHTEALCSLARLFFAQQDWEDALRYSQPAAGQGAPDMHRISGLALLQRQDTANGIRYLQAALECNPDDTAALHHLAHACFRKGDYSTAAALWSRLLHLQPQNAFALFMLGQAYIKLGDARGERLCEQAVSL